MIISLFYFFDCTFIKNKKTFIHPKREKIYNMTKLIIR